MPGQATAPSDAKPKKTDVKKKTDEDDENTKRDKADLVTIEVAERQLAILAPPGKTNGAAPNRAAKVNRESA
jgi:hypothetical protein